MKTAIRAAAPRAALTLCLLTLFVAPIPAAFGQRPDTLAQALGSVEYDPLKRGPLLVVDPASARLDEGPQAWSLVWRENWRATAREIAPLFGLRFENVGTVSALVPEKMAVLNGEPLPAEEYAKLGRGRAMYLLAASLTEDQWRRIGGAQGLGEGDLASDGQRGLFRAVLPRPFVMKRVISSEGGGYYSYSTQHYGETGIPPALTLTPAQLAQVRLRVTRRASWMFEPENAPTARSGYGTGNQRPAAAGQARFILDSADAPDERDELRRTLRTLVPNRPKRGDLDYTSPMLDARVPLAGPKTVGDLVQRAAEATRLELYADRRVAALPVTLAAAAGQSARAGDLLKAVGYAVTGTFRAVEDPAALGGGKVYLLTDDVPGIAPRRLRQVEWQSDADALTWDEQARVEKALRERNVAPAVGFAPDDPNALPPALMQSVEKSLAEKQGSEVPLSVADLPPALQESIQGQLAQYAQLGAGQVRKDRVHLQVSLGTQILVPGVGEFDGPSLGGLPSLLPRKVPPPPGTAATAPPPAAGAAATAAKGPVALPMPFAARSALLVSPATPDEARAAVQAARARGVARVFVVVSTDSADAAPILTAAVEEAARAEKLTVWAAVRLLRRPAAASEVSSDRNVFGETPAQHAARRQDAPEIRRLDYWRGEIVARGRWDWLRLDDSGTRTALAGALARLAATPGLAGLVLLDTAAPGHALPPANSPNTPLLGTYLGYTPALRLAMIRRENADPVDLLPSGGVGVYEGEMPLPFFPEERYGPTALPGVRRTRDPKTGAWKAETPAPGDTLWSGWDAVRRDGNRRGLALLGAELRKRLPEGMPLLLGLPNPDGALWASGYALWEKTDAPPRMEDKPKGNFPPGGAAAGAGEWLVPLVATDRTEPERLAQTGIAALRDRAARFNGGGWNGVVLDLSTLPMEKALRLLSGALAVAAKE